MRKIEKRKSLREGRLRNQQCGGRDKLEVKRKGTLGLKKKVKKARRAVSQKLGEKGQRSP